MRRRVLALLVAAVAISALTAGPAVADPMNKNTFVIGLNCGDAGAFDIVVHGSSDWASAQVLGSNAVVVPLRFQNVTFTYTDPGGNTFTESDPDLNVKGSGKQQGVWCGFSFDVDTGNGQENFSGSGEAYVKITPGN